MTAQETFNRYAEKAANMSIEGLRYSLRDCIAAARACSGHDTVREGQYYDEAFAYRNELNKRNATL